MANWTYVPEVGFDRFGMAAENALRLDPGGVATALFDPQRLSPSQRGMTEEGWRPKGDDPFSRVLRTVANPLVVIGAVLAFKYRVPLAKNMFNFSKVVAGYEKALVPIIWRLQSAESIFRGTPFLKYLHGILDSFHNFRAKVLTKLAGGLTEVEATLGRSLTFREGAAAVMVREGMYDPNHPTWRLVRELARKHLGPEWAAKIERVGIGNEAGLRALVPAGFQESLTDALKEASDIILRKFEAITDPKQRSLFIKQLNAMGLDGEEVYSRLQQAAAMGKERLTKANVAMILDGYYPHVGVHEASGKNIRMWRQLVSEALGETEAKTLSDATPALADQLKRRFGRMIPEARTFQEIADQFTPETSEVLTALSKVTKEVDGVVVPVVREYSLRPIAVMEHYAHSVGRTVAWTIEGWGPLIKEEVRRMSETGDPIKTRLAIETFVPAAMGKLTPSEAMYSLGWSGLKKTAAEFFENPHVRKAIGEKQADWILKQLARPSIQDLSWKTAGAKLSSYFYLSTLGLNVPSAALNIMQNLLTTSSVVEGKYLFGGLRKTLAGIDRFANLVAKEGRSLEQAFEMAFPEYANIGSVSEIEALAAIRRAKAGGVGAMSTVESIKAAMMSLFTATERFNKLWAWNSAMMKALAEGLDAVSAKEFARQIVNITQFPGGLTNTGVGMINWWAPFRQFVQFPRAIGELLLSHGRALGSGAQAFPESWPIIGGQNWGTMGRMLTATGLLYGAGAAAGLKLPGLWEALPAPHGEDQPFFPFPFVPPILALPGAVAADMFSGGGEKGDWSRTKRALPLLVPGGVALARASTVLSPELAKRLGREYADYDHPMPDGTIPVYSADGGLKGFKSTARLIADAVGWKTLAGDPEAELVEYLIKQRDKIRDYRRAYLERLAANDMAGARALNEEYKRNFPNTGDIAVKPSDIEAIHARHDITRIERVLQTLPPEVRPMFGQMIAVAMGETAQQFLGVDPALFSNPATPTVKKRDPFRSRPQGPQTQALQNAIGGEGSKGVLRADHLGQKPRPSLSPFEPYSGWE